MNFYLHCTFQHIYIASIHKHLSFVHFFEMFLSIINIRRREYMKREDWDGLSGWGKCVDDSLYSKFHKHDCYGSNIFFMIQF